MLNFENYPNLQSYGYQKTSDCTWDYNCISWAVNKLDSWWWPFGGVEAYWPKTAPNKDTVHAFERMFNLHHYKRCRSDELEPGFEKVAIFALDGKVKHAARQLDNGSWTHKMGSCIDLETNLRAVEGPRYGSVALVLRRKRP